MKIMSELSSKKHQELPASTLDEKSFRTMDVEALKIGRCFDDIFNEETKTKLQGRHHKLTVFDIMPEHINVTDYGSVHNAILCGDHCLALVGDG